MKRAETPCVVHAGPSSFGRIVPAIETPSCGRAVFPDVARVGAKSHWAKPRGGTVAVKQLTAFVNLLAGLFHYALRLR
jgi:hypothetical protein